jgi:hypothetical protein
MRKVKYLLLAALTVSLVGVSGAEEKKEERKPATIKEIMKKAHAGEKDDKMCAKFAAGKLSEAEVKDILALYEDLGKNKPPKGDEEAWKKKTAALLAAAKDLAAKKDGGADAFKKAVNCMACHTDHRPPQDKK